MVEGGENRFVHQLPKAVKHPNLALKRGLASDRQRPVQLVQGACSRTTSRGDRPKRRSWCRSRRRGRAAAQLVARPRLAGEVGGRRVRCDEERDRDRDDGVRLHHAEADALMAVEIGRLVVQRRFGGRAAREDAEARSARGDRPAAARPASREMRGPARRDRAPRAGALGDQAHHHPLLGRGRADHRASRRRLPGDDQPGRLQALLLGRLRRHQARRRAADRQGQRHRRSSRRSTPRRSRFSIVLDGTGVVADTAGPQRRRPDARRSRPSSTPTAAATTSRTWSRSPGAAASPPSTAGWRA